MREVLGKIAREPSPGVRTATEINFSILFF
jgi:hypothetical protein